MPLNKFLHNDIHLMIKGVTSDSRQVRKGYLFAALPGSKADGTEFVEDAITHGATFVLTPRSYVLPEEYQDTITVIPSDNTRLDFSKIAAQYYQLQPKQVVAVTGTSGKTSTVSFVQQLLHLNGIENCASMGTLGLRGPKMRKAGKLTTPDTQSLHAAMADLSAAGVDYLAMEASSHGLDQYRLDSVKIQAAGYTNLSRDHLDYHATMEEYFDAKSRLFSEVMVDNGRAVLNADDAYFDALKDICVKKNHTIISYGKNGQDIKIINHTAQPKGQEVKLMVNGAEHIVTLPLVGEFQIMNALCAFALVEPYVEDSVSLLKSMEKLRGVPGRLQLIDGHEQGAIYIDYAHKPAALETILNTLRPHTKNKLVCIFGCGGNRDKGKRAIMGEIAERLADKVVVTDDNPRNEEADSIRSEILATAKNAIEIGDREEAIRQTITTLEEGDVLVVAGKGHEEGQMIKGIVHPFNDADVVQKIIESLK